MGRFHTAGNGVSDDDTFCDDRKYNQTTCWPVVEDIIFSHEFNSAPQVIASISRLDTFHGANTRVVTYADSVTAQGFKAHIERSGDDTLLYQVDLSWIACGI